jgi:hypothetical protein
VCRCYTEAGSVSRSLYHLDIKILKLVKLSLLKKMHAHPINEHIMHPICMNVFNKLDHQRPCEANGIGGDKPSLSFTLIFIIEIKSESGKP